MEKHLTSAIATVVSVLLLFVYVLPYYAPSSLAASPSNSSMVINGSIPDMSAPNVMLFIINRDDPDPNHFSVYPVSPSSFSIEIPMQGGASFSNGSHIGFKINGKDTGYTTKFIVNTTLENYVLTFNPPVTQPVYSVNSPATPVPFKINASVTPTATDTQLPPSVTPGPTSNTPTVNAAGPSPTATFPVNAVIIAILIGIVLLALVIFFLRKK